MKISVFYHHVLEAAAQTGRTVDSILDEIRAAGITGLEMNADQLDDIPTVKAMLEAHDMEVSNVCADFHFESDDDPAPGRRAVDKAIAIGCPRVMPIPGFFPDGSDHEEVYKTITKPLAELTAYAVSKGIDVTLEDFDSVKSPIATAEGMKYFADHIPGVGYTFDCGNFAYSDQDEGYAFDLLQDKIRHCHCKDRSATPVTGERALTSVGGRDLYPCAFGSGFIRTDEILNRLKAQGYDSWLTIEHFGANDHLGYMLKSAEFLKKYL